MPNGTQLTHAKWAESTRCSACGRMPEAEQRDDEQRARRGATCGRRAPRASPATSKNAITAEQQEEPQEELLRRARARGSASGAVAARPARLQEAVDVRPRRRDRKAAPAAQVEHGIEHHARAHVSPSPAVATWIDVRSDTDRRARPAVASRAAGRMPRTSATLERPTARIRSSRNRTATPSSTPAVSAHRRALRSPRRRRRARGHRGRPRARAHRDRPRRPTPARSARTGR